MHNACICSTITMTNESLSDCANDYFYLLNGVRQNVRFPLLSHCSCCEFSINPCIAYASRQSNLIRISSSRRLIFVGSKNEISSHDMLLGCNGHLHCSIWVRGVSGKVVRGAKESLSYEDTEKNRKKYQTCAASDAEAMLSFLMEELGEKDCGVRRLRNGSSFQKVQSKEGRGAVNECLRGGNKYDFAKRNSLRNPCCEEEKEEFSSHPNQKVRKGSSYKEVQLKPREDVVQEGFREKNKVDLLKHKSTIKLESPKNESSEQENKGPEINEGSSSCQNHIAINTISSSSSYYSMSSLGDLESDAAEDQIQYGGSVKGSPRKCMKYLGRSVEVVIDEEQNKVDKSINGVHENEEAIVQGCSTRAGSLPWNCQKNSENKLAKMVTNESISTKELLEKDSKLPAPQQKCSKLDFNQWDVSNRGDVLVDANSIKGTRDDHRQKVSYISEHKSGRDTSQRNPNTSEVHGWSSNSNQQSEKNDTVVLCSEITRTSDSETQHDFMVNKMEGNHNLDFNSWAKSEEQHSKSNQKTIEKTEPRKGSQCIVRISSAVQSIDAEGKTSFNCFETSEKGKSNHESCFTPVMKSIDLIRDEQKKVDEDSLQIESIKKLPKPREISSFPDESLSLMSQAQLGGIVSSQPMINPPLSQFVTRDTSQDLQFDSSMHFVGDYVEKVHTKVNTSENPEEEKSGNDTLLYKDEKHRQKNQSNGSKGSSDENHSFQDLFDSSIVKKPRSSWWNIFEDIVRWSSRGKSSSNDSIRSDAWFSGVELDLNSEESMSQSKRGRSLRTHDKKLNLDPRRCTEKKTVHSSQSDHPSSSKDISSSISVSNTSFCSLNVGETLNTGKDSIKSMDKPASTRQVKLLETEEGRDGELRRWKFQRSNQAQKDCFDEWEETFKLEIEKRKIDELFMREALLEAKKAADTWEVPVGAVLVQNGKIIARGCNLVEELRDSTAHAEMICIRMASNSLRSWRLAETTLYVTLEPCPMCAGAILQARIDTLVWGAPNKLLGADGSWIRLFPNSGVDGECVSEVSDKLGAPAHPFHPKMVIRRGILQSECADAMQQFFHLRKRNKGRESSSSSLSVSHLPSKFMSRFHNIFRVIFCSG